MRVLAHAELFLLALTAFALLTGALCSALAPRALSRLGAWAPARRYVALWLLCAAPLVTSCSLFLAALAPAVWSLLEPSYDHCLVHDDGHAHLCFVHGPPFAAHAALWVLASFASALALLKLLRRLHHALRDSLTVRALVRTGTARPDGSIELDAPGPLCVAAGLFRPRVLVSRALTARLPPHLLQAVIAHEASHVRRRDALANALAALMSVLYAPHARARLLEALRLAAEETCDEAAASMVGDRVTVAEAIVAVARLGETARFAPGVALGMGGLAIEARVHALLGRARVAGSLRRLLVPTAVLALSLVLGADALHHLVESVLSSLLE